MNQNIVRSIQIVSSISEEASGSTYAVVRLCESLIDQKQNVTICALDWLPMSSPPPFLKSFPLALGPRRLGRSNRMHSWLTAQSQTQSVDLLHNHGLWMMPNVYAGWVARKHIVPLVVSPHGTLSEWSMRNGSVVKRGFWPLVQRPALGATACFHATAASEYEEIRRLGFRQPVAVIPNGIDIPDLRPIARKEPRTLLFLGRIHPKKGLDMLLSAWRVVQERFPEWQLRIVGPDNGGYLADMRRLAGEMHLKRIEFSGALHGAQKLSAYREADLFVLPTYSENFGLVVAEALAVGVPTIVTRGAPWAGIELRQAGWWIDIGIDPLVVCLEDALARSPETLAEMGQFGRRWMEVEFTWARVAQKIAETYRWVLHGGDKPEWVIEG